MAKHHLALFVHLIWTTPDRQPLLDAATRMWLWPAMSEKARMLGAIPVVVGGAADHVHVAARLPHTLSVADLAKQLKGTSSRMVALRGMQAFRWQEGYGAFTVSYDRWHTVAAYVANQEAHHAAGVTLDGELELPGQRPGPEGTS